MRCGLICRPYRDDANRASHPTQAVTRINLESI